MKDLIGVVSRDTLSIINSTTRLRFRDASKFRTAEALLLYEQRVLPTEELFRMCNAEYDEELETIESQYIPKDIILGLANQDLVPLIYNNVDNVIVCGIIPEKHPTLVNYEAAQLEYHYVPIYDYVRLYTKYYGQPDFLYTIPATDKLEYIIAEAVELEAADITITNTLEGSRVYYNVRKRKVNSRRSLTRDDVEELALVLCTRANQARQSISVEPLYLANRLDEHHRGRIAINKNFYGVAISVRVLGDDPLNMTLEQLNIKPNAIQFIREYIMDRTPGLRLWIGETMSGKNTSICCVLSDIAKLDQYKIVSVEQPVETPIPNVEQLEVNTEEEFALVAGSLVRQNPDIVYIVEMNHLTALDTVKVANTSKVVFSTIHANSIAETPSRIMDLTGLSLDRVIMCMHSCVYQKLVRNEEEDKLYPQLHCVAFDEQFKQQLYGKPLYEVQTLIKEREDQWEC